MRYYTSDPPYRRKGPPEPLLRLLAPLVVLTTLTVFASGVALLLIGPSSRGPLLLVHKASFILWVAVAAVHVLGHLPEIGRLFRLAPNSQREMNELRSGSGRPAPPRSDSGHRARTSPGGPPGRSGRALSLVAALAGGLVLAVALIPQFAVWTDVVFRHH
jgi:hypothetical protein